jgi:predicted RNA binding protein YcfA (HicA-like mRNA interferase family)
MGVFTVQEVIWALEHNGWERIRFRGDHRQFRCKGNRYVITVAGKPSDDVKKGILKNIERLSGLRFREIYGR